MLPSAERYAIFFGVWFSRSQSAKTKYMNNVKHILPARAWYATIICVRLSAWSAEKPHTNRMNVPLCRRQKNTDHVSHINNMRCVAGGQAHNSGRFTH
jgi:hypothetical protein